MTLFSRMKRTFNQPLPKTMHSYDHFKARQRAQSDLPGWHPVQLICVAVGGLSLLALAVTVFLQIIASAGSEMPSVAFLVKLDSAMYLSAAALFASVCVLVGYNRFRKI